MTDDGIGYVRLSELWRGVGREYGWATDVPAVWRARRPGGEQMTENESIPPTAAPALLFLVCVTLALWFAFVDANRSFFAVSMVGAALSAMTVAVVRAWLNSAAINAYSS